MTGCRYVLLLAILVIGMIQDFWRQRISSRLILIGLLSGILFRFYMDHLSVAVAVCIFADFMLPVLILFPLFLIRALGAGDIKLCSLIGCWIGFPESFTVIWLAFVLGSLWYLVTFPCRRSRQAEPFAWTFAAAVLLRIFLTL